MDNIIVDCFFDSQCRILFWYDNHCTTFMASWMSWHWGWETLLQRLN